MQLFTNTTMDKGFYTKRDFDERFTFHLNEWIEELTSTELSFLATCANYLQENPEDLLDLLFNRKKRQALIKKYELMKLKKQYLSTQRATVLAFFEQTESATFLSDLARIPYLFPYEVETNCAHFIIGEKNGDAHIPFQLKQLHDYKITYYHEDLAVSLSIQALAYFVLANELLHSLDEQRLTHALKEVAELNYATSYSQALLEAHYELFYINFPHNCITSFYLTVISFNKGLRFLQESRSLEEIASNDALVAQLAEAKLQLPLAYIDTLNNCYIAYQNQTAEKLKAKEQAQLKKTADLLKKQEKLKENYEKQLALNTQLKSELKNKPATIKVDTTLTNDLVKKTKELQDEITLHKKDIKRLTNEVARYEEQEHNEIKSLRQENGVLQRQVVEIKRSAVQSEELSFEEWLKKGKQFLQNISTAQEDALQNFLHLAHDTIEERKASRPKIALASNKIGYCLVNNEGHYIRLADDTIEAIQTIPDNVYLSDNEFIEVTKDFEFARKLPGFFRPGSGDNAIVHFAQIEQIHQDYFAKFDGKSVRYKTDKNFNPRNGQIIALNEAHDLVRYYTSKQLTLDDLIESIKLKGHQPYYIELALKNGYAVRDVLTNEQSFISLQAVLSTSSFIIVKDEQELMYTDYSGLIYKRSNFYKHKMLVSISELDDEIFVLKSNQEYVILTTVLNGYVPELGDMLWVDEHNAMISLVEEPEEDFSTATIEQKLKNHPTMKVLRQTPKKPVLINQKLVIIGNIRLSERYKSHFAQLGFETETVDGFGSFEKIRMACGKADMIIYSTAFTSHKNSGKVKTDIPQYVILCDSTSPNVIYRTVEAQIS